ncbi:S4 domain-containing protein, partial [bacterium]|nr:S4 domain-containing protein [bacterium]
MAKSRKTKQDNGATIDVADQKQRADALLLTRGLARSRDRARDLIAEGAVLAAGEIVRKASKMLAIDCDITVTSAGNPWVSRAGMKLAGGLAKFPMIEVAGRYAIDIGASTGGFTEVLLAHDAAHVVAIDVGNGQ